MIFSHSRISCFKQCPKLYEYKYLKNIYPISDNDNFYLGSLVHKGVELGSVYKLNNYLDEIDVPFSEKQETNNVLSLGMVEAYFNKFGNNEQILHEVHFEIEIQGKKVQGYIDGIIDTPNGYYLMELKTASQINKEYIDKLEFNDQISTYYYVILNNLIEGLKLDKPLLGIKYRIIKKPQIRQKINETVDEFRNRLVEKLSEEDYITEVVLHRTAEEVNEHIEDLIEDINTIENTKRFTKSMCGCTTYGRCPYMSICSKETNYESLYEVREKEEPVEEIE